MDDPELNAMKVIAEALSQLEEGAKARVLEWVSKRFAPLPAALSVVASVSEGNSAQFGDFPSLFDAANPQTAADRALVAAYWFQVVQGQDDFDSFALNRELKHLGHPSTNITRDLDALMSRTPRFVLQTRKSGSSRQARKLYKLTHEGVRYTQDLLVAAQPKESS